MCDVLPVRHALVLSNGFELPPIGYGTYPNTDSLIDSIPFAVKCGCRLVDSSDNYGDERLVGEGLARCGDAADDVVVVSKFSLPRRTYQLESCFARGEAALGHQIDVYLLHWPYPHLWKDQWRRIEQLYLEGRCSAIGVCNFERDRLEELLRFCEVAPMVNQFECHPIFQQRNLVEYCRDVGIVTMSYSPVARMIPELVESEALTTIASAHARTISQVILRWNIQHKRIPIPSSKSTAHIAENFNVFDFSLGEEEMAAIDAMELGRRVRYDPKTRFGTVQHLRFLAHRLLRY